MNSTTLPENTPSNPEITSAPGNTVSSFERGREKPVQGVRLRALMVALPLVVGISYLSVYADMVAKSVQFGVLQLAPPAVVGLFLLALGNRVLTKLRGREWLSQGDCIIIYAMLLISVMVSTRGFIEKLIPPLASLPYYSTQENGWNEKLTQHMPGFAVPFDPLRASPAPEWIRTYFEAVKPGEAIPFHLWIAPLLMWLILIGCVLLTFASLATLLRRQWMDNEQLRFPLTTLPLALVRDEVEGQPFFSNKTMWAGFAVSAIVFGINGLRANFPDWPQLVTFVDFSPFLTERPWNSIGWAPAYISLAAVGFFFFLPTDLLFSLWFFYLLSRAQQVGATMLGGMPTAIGTHNATVWTGYQAAGAYVVLVIAQIRIAWPYLQQVWRKILHPSTHNTLDDRDEMMSYRSAFAGLLLGFAGIIVWLWIAGMSPLVAMAQMGIYIFLIAVIMTRAVNEAGLLMTETSFLPSHLINLVHPIGSLGAANATMLGLTNIVFVRDLRGVMLSPLMDSQKMASETRVRLRSLLPVLALAVLISYACASYFFLKFSYSLSNSALYGYPPANVRNMFSRAADPGAFSAPGGTEYGGFALGIVVTTLLTWMRGAFAWFPLHPLAYAVAPTWVMLVFWLPCLIAWIAKSCVLRFGGIDTFRKLAPFALGLILGEFTSAVFWSMLSMSSPTILGFKFTSTPDFPWP